MLMNAIRQLRERWRKRRDRKKRLNAARYEPHGKGDDFGGGGGGVP